ncbi:MAG TPA: TonB-dependent receptor [Longimicrobium sp.]|nr:TonB-dependent receptor [Longimicrobium sp.]
MPSRSFRAACAGLLLLAAIAAPAHAQTGRIAGRVIDTGTGRPIAGARVAVIIAPARSAVTAVDGTYQIRNVPAGAYSVAASHLGHATKTVTDVRVGAGAAVSLDISLAPRALAMEGITVTAARERGSVNRALDEQRTATGVVNAVTADQIARSPDSDAAQAVQRVSGVTVESGKYVSVRGLGERYTTTSLNGSRIPSPEPERRVVPLDLFPASLLESVTTSKTFTPDQSGDFSGAQVNIRTREFPTRNTLNASFSTGYNSAATGRQHPFAPTTGREWLGFGGSTRSVPAPVAGTDFGATLGREEMNRVAGSFRNSWSARREDALPNLSAGVSGGGGTSVFGRDLGYLVSGTYSHSTDARVGEIRSTALADSAGDAAEASRFEGTTGINSVLWGGLVNLSARLGEATSVTFNNSYNRSADNEARRERGYTENLGRNLPLDIDRLRFVERSVRSTQLTGLHQLFTGHRFDWTLSSSGVSRVEPDRSEIVYVTETDPATGNPLPRAWFGGSNEAAVRTFGDLRENSFEGAANYQVEIGRHRIKFGGLARTTDRDADNRSYSISAPGTLSRAERERSPEEIFDGRSTGSGSSVFNVTPLGAGGSYDAEDRIVAGYGMVEIAATERMRLVGGARVERSQVTVNSTPTTGKPVTTNPTYTDILPSAALNVTLTDAQNLRFSVSRTLSRPEYRELAPILYREVIGAENVFGNPDLKRALIDNADARWEWYPNSGEILSFGVFAKRFNDPIERVYVAASGTPLVTFVNAERAVNYGVEVEARKQLGSMAAVLEPLSVFANATVMRSEIRIGDAVSSKTRDNRPMVGQAPYVVNGGVTYTTSERGASATLLFNTVGRRIVNASEAPLPDVFEESRNVLDFSLRLPLRGSMELKLDAENLLDEPYEVRQGNVVREYYRAGRQFGLGVSLRK